MASLCYKWISLRPYLIKRAASYQLLQLRKQSGVGAERQPLGETVEQVLINNLNCVETEAKTIVLHNPFLLVKKAPLVKETINCLFSKGISSDQIKNNAWILDHSPSFLLPKLFFVEKVGFCSASLLLLKLPEKRLNQVVKKMVSENIISTEQIKMLEEAFQCSSDEMVLCIQMQPLLLTIKKEKLHELINLLKEVGITLDDIRNHLWLFSRKLDTLHYRLTSVKKSQMKNIKPWLLLCSDKRFELSFQSWLKLTKQNLKSQ